MATLIVIREAGLMGVLRSLPIAVNGHLISLRAGGRTTQQVAPGEIEICTAMDWVEPCCWVLTVDESTERVEVRLRPTGAFGTSSTSNRQFAAYVSPGIPVRQVEFSALRVPVDLWQGGRLAPARLAVSFLLGLVAWVAGLYLGVPEGSPTG